MQSVCAYTMDFMSAHKQINLKNVVITAIAFDTPATIGK